jgi:DNA polymerase phi
MGDAYARLGDPNETIRLRAIATVVQNVLDSSNNDSKGVERALNKLIRGLCSGRDVNRVGYSIALTEVGFHELSEMDDI